MSEEARTREAAHAAAMSEAAAAAAAREASLAKQLDVADAARHAAVAARAEEVSDAHAEQEDHSNQKVKNQGKRRACFTQPIMQDNHMSIISSSPDHSWINI